jgi:beta-glucosidase/6-phospho-beta-glucosidase/beta-galactosidase
MRMARANLYGTDSLIPGKVGGGVTGDVACNQYHLYPQDIALAKRLNQKSYRFPSPGRAFSL